MGTELNKSRLESVLSVNRINFDIIESSIDLEKGTLEKLIKDPKPIPKNVSRKVVDYLQDKAKINCSDYLYNLSDNINFAVTKTPTYNIDYIKKDEKKVKNPYGATTKDTKLDGYIANHLNFSTIKARCKLLGFNNQGTMGLFFRDKDNKIIYEIANQVRRKYITEEEANMLSFLLESNIESLAVSKFDHTCKNPAPYKAPGFAKYIIIGDMYTDIYRKITKQKLLVKLHLSERVYDMIINGEITIGLALVKFFINIYNSITGETLDKDSAKGVLYEEKIMDKEEEVKVEKENNNIEIDMDNLPESWKNNSKKEETADNNEINYSCKCGNLKSNKWKSGQKCNVCGTLMRKVGAYDLLDNDVQDTKLNSTSNNPIKEAVNSDIKILKQLADPSVPIDNINIPIEEPTKEFYDKNLDNIPDLIKNNEALTSDIDEIYEQGKSKVLKK